MADVGLLDLDQFLGQVVESLKVITRVRDGTRGESQPLNHFYSSQTEVSLAYIDTTHTHLR